MARGLADFNSASKSGLATHMNLVAFTHRHVWNLTYMTTNLAIDDRIIGVVRQELLSGIRSPGQ